MIDILAHQYESDLKKNDYKMGYKEKEQALSPPKLGQSEQEFLERTYEFARGLGILPFYQKS